MIAISINHNYNGKLFADNFSHIEPFSHDYEEGMQLELIHQGISFGIVEIRKIKVMHFARITEVMSFLFCGKPLYYLAAQLNEEYNKGVPHAGEKLFMHMVLGYAARNVANQTKPFQDWWASKSDVNTLKTQS